MSTKQITKGAYDKVRAFMQSKFGHTDGEQPHAGAGSHRSGAFESYHDYDGLGVFKDGVSALAGRGGHTLSKSMDEHMNVEGSEAPRSHGIADRSTKPVDVEDEGSNRAHIGPGREFAMKESRASGSMHPMEHAGKMGKGRW